MIKRIMSEIITQKLNKGKAIIVLGPRQTGKTTLIKELLKITDNYLFLDCDDMFIRESLTNANTMQLKQLLGNYKTVFIDEAQRIKNIGLILKIITDQFSEVQLLVSGSSAFELSDEINEPLTGRKWEYFLYPISWSEFENNVGYLSSQQQLEQRLVYGMYPDVINNIGNEKEVLKQLTSSYLYKDLLSYKGLRKPDILEQLLKALALQIGSEVSYNELSRLLQVDKNTVSNYINLLEKTYIIFRLEPFSRNIRTEINSNRKIYFYDNGIRNALISNYNPIDIRADKGALWENFLISERKKANEYFRNFSNCYFWRTKQMQEIDYIEERNGQLYAFEFKWIARKTYIFPRTFSENYANSEYKIIDKNNFLEFLNIDIL